MQNITSSILASINRPKNRRPNVLTSCVHEGFQSNFATFDATFYLYKYPGCGTWNERVRPLPKNYVILNGDEKKQFKTDIVFDLIWSQNKFGAFQNFVPISQSLNIPLVSLEHTLPVIERRQQIQMMNSLRGKTNIFLTNNQFTLWGWDKSDPSVKIIPCAVDTDFFTPAEDWTPNGQILTVGNKFIERDYFLNWTLYKRVTDGLPNIVVGDNPGIGEPSKNPEDLREKYRNCGVYFCSTRLSTMSNSMLEAMSCGCPMVVTDTCSHGEWIKDGINGFISNNEKYLREKLEWCLKNTDKAREMGLKARETAVKEFGLEKHLNAWKVVFDDCLA